MNLVMLSTADLILVAEALESYAFWLLGIKVTVDRAPELASAEVVECERLAALVTCEALARRRVAA